MISRPKTFRVVPLVLVLGVLFAAVSPLAASAYWFNAFPPPAVSVEAGDSVSRFISTDASSACSNIDFSFQKLSGPSWITHTDLGWWAQVTAAPPSSTSSGTHTATWRVTGTSSCGTSSVNVSWQVTVY